MQFGFWVVRRCFKVVVGYFVVVGFSFDIRFLVD